MLTLVRSLYDRYVQALTFGQDLFLLVIRLYWGWAFFQTGYGKLQNIENVVGFFEKLNIPMPLLNAYLAGGTECFGGLCLLLGLGSRLMTVPLCFTMVIAYVTAEREALFGLFAKPDAFFDAAPFLFLYASLVVLLFGPGRISIDALIGKLLPKPQE